MQQEDEPRGRIVHRLEAFSDIVIGFSLAQLGVGLAIPLKIDNLFAHPGWLLTFLWAFGMICTMWLFHHRLFTHWFLPKPLTIILNFVWLAAVVLLAYDTQLVNHFPASPVVWRFYFILYTLAYGLLALEYFLCFRLQSASADPKDRSAGIRGITFMTFWTAPFALCAIYAFVFPWGDSMAELIWGTFIAFGAASMVIEKIVRRFRKATA